MVFRDAEFKLLLRFLSGDVQISWTLLFPDSTNSWLFFPSLLCWPLLPTWLDIDDSLPLSHWPSSLFTMSLDTLPTTTILPSFLWVPGFNIHQVEYSTGTWSSSCWKPKARTRGYPHEKELNVSRLHIIYKN